MENPLSESKKKKLIIIAVIASLTIGYALCNYSIGGEYETTDNAQLDGDILPFRAGITGYIEKINFKDNQQVKKGDTLIVFDTGELRAKIRAAEAALANVRAAIVVSSHQAIASNQQAIAAKISSLSEREQIAAAKAVLDKSKQDLVRMEKLFQINAATQAQLDNAQKIVHVAQADYNQAIQQKDASFNSAEGLHVHAMAEKSQIFVGQAMIQQREAELTIEKEQLGHAYVIAPYDGIVTKRSIQQGQFLSTGQSMCALICTQLLWITANFKETQLNHIKIGQDVEIRLDAFPNLKLKGKVQSFTGTTGAKFSLVPPDNATGNFIKTTQRFPIRIKIETDHISGVTLYPGLSASVSVKTN